MKTALRIFSVFLCVILSISLFSVVISMAAVVSIEESLTKTAINNAFNGIETEDIIAVFDKSENEQNESNVVFTNTVKTEIDEKPENFEIPQKFIDELKNSDALKEFLSEYISQVINYVLTGKKTDLVTAEKLEAIIGDSIPLIEEKSGVKISDEDKTVLFSYIEEFSKKTVENLPTYQIIDEKLSFPYLNLIRFVFSLKMKIIFLITLVIIFLLLGLFRMSPYKWLIWSGIPIMLSAVIFVGLGAFGTTLVKYFDMGNEFANKFGKNYSSVIFFNFLTTGIVLFGIGLLMILIYILIRNNLRKQYIASHSLFNPIQNSNSPKENKMINIEEIQANTEPIENTEIIDANEKTEEDEKTDI